MDEEELLKALDVIIEALSVSELKLINKVELMINLKHFLNPKKYQENLETLRRKDIEDEYKKKFRRH